MSSAAFEILTSRGQGSFGSAAAADGSAGGALAACAATSAEVANSAAIAIVVVRKLRIDFTDRLPADTVLLSAL
jgi:hypothetical protein